MTTLRPFPSVLLLGLFQLSGCSDASQAPESHDPGTDFDPSGGTGGATSIPASGGADPGASGGAAPAGGTPNVEDAPQELTLRLDTTMTGANVSEDVSGYPLFIRLDQTTFDFASAAGDGSDVHFVDAASNLLPHQIESWDPIGQTAALWVLVPQILGDNKEQFLKMKWGQAAPAASNAAEVFPQESGFLGVWHLNEEGNELENGYLDSSSNQVHGTGIRLGASARVEGRVGPGTRFDNPSGGSNTTSQWIRMSGEKVTDGFNPSGDQPLTITAWVKADSFEGYYDTFLSKGDSSYTLQCDWDNRIEACTKVDGYHSCAIIGGSNFCQSNVVGKWIYFFMTLAPGNIHLTMYDGETTQSANSGGTTIPGSHDFGIGNQTQYAHRDDAERAFDGTIDEVRVMNALRSAAWGKLDFESQREAPTLVSIEAKL